MKALRVKNGELHLAEIAAPEIADETLVRVLKSGICNTDLEIARGYAGFQGTIGHEFVGVVEQSPDAPHLVGKRVVGEINAGCGVCHLCLQNDSRHCPTRTVLGIVGRDGAHAEFLSLPSRNLIAVADEISNDEAVFVEPLAAANGILEQINPQNDEKIAVVGDGKLGLLCALALSLANPNVLLIGKHAEKLKIAAAANVETILLADAAKLHGDFDYAVEASGAESGFETALNLLKPHGRLILKSTFHGTPRWQAARVVVDEITIIGSRCGKFAPALELLKTRQINFQPFITAEFALSDAVAAMSRAAQKGILKILLDPTQ